MNKLWHNMISMPKEDRTWHEQDMAGAMTEYFEGQGAIMNWSELRFWPLLP